MARDAFLATTTHRVSQFSVRCYAEQQDPSVVLDFGEVSMHAFDPAVLVALAAAVAEAQGLLISALAGQDQLPAEPPAAVA